MLKVHGFAVSNYFNMVRMALMEKGAPFEVVTVFPNQQAEYLARSPLGKVPCLETPEGFLAETSVILEYIEDTVTGPSFLPSEPYPRARVRQAVKMMELYVELPARRLFGGVFFGRENPAHTVAEVEPVLRSGAAGLGRVLACGEFVMGDQLTLADFMALYSFSLAAQVARQVYDWDIVAEIPGLAPVLARLAARPTAQALDAEMRAGMPAFQAAIRARS